MHDLTLINKGVSETFTAFFLVLVSGFALMVCIRFALRFIPQGEHTERKLPKSPLDRTHSTRDINVFTQKAGETLSTFLFLVVCLCISYSYTGFQTVAMAEQTKGEFRIQCLAMISSISMTSPSRHFYI